MKQAGKGKALQNFLQGDHQTASFFLAWRWKGRKIRKAPRHTTGIYRAVLTYQPKFSAIQLNTIKEDLAGPTKNILISPFAGFQHSRLMQKAMAHRATKVMEAAL